MAFNFGGNNDEDTSFERGNPVQQGAKNITKATTSQIQQQQKAFTKALTDQLYGPTPETPQKDEKKELPPGMETIQKQLGQNNSADEKQLEETRKKLQAFQNQHRDSYFEKTMGESARKKIEQEETQKEQAKRQEDEEAKQREADAKAAQEESLAGVMPQGKHTGRNRMQKPMAVKLAETKTESNRGTTG